MTDREILAELKQSYDFLTDIEENGSNDHCCGQLAHDLTNKLIEAKDIISFVYNKFYNTLNEETFKTPIKDVYIGSYPYIDYEIKDEDGEDTTTCGDVGFYWYSDKDYIMEDINE